MATNSMASFSRRSVSSAGASAHLDKLKGRFSAFANECFTANQRATREMHFSALPLNFRFSTFNRKRHA